MMRHNRTRHTSSANTLAPYRPRKITDDLSCGLKVFVWSALSIFILFIMGAYAHSAEQKTLRVGVGPNPPIVFQDADGVTRGIYADLLNAMAQQEDWKIEYVLESWDNGLKMLKERQLDLITGIAYSEERDLYADFSQEVVVTVWGTVLVPMDSSINKVEELQGRKIAVLHNGINGQNFRNLCKKFGVTCELMETSSCDAAVKMVERGEADAAIVNSVFASGNTGQYMVKSSTIGFSPIPLFFAVPKGGDSSLLQTIDACLREWKGKNDSPYHTTLHRWFITKHIYVTPAWVLPLVSVTSLGAVFLFIWIVLLRRQITRRRKAEKALRLSENKYRELVQDANSIILRWNPDGQITFFNEFAQSFFGFSEEEILGKHVVGTIVPETESTGRDLLPLMNEIAQNPLKYQSNVNENMLKNGERVWVAWTNKVLFDEEGHPTGALSIGTDITDRKQTEDALRTSRDTFQAVMDSLDVLVYVADFETYEILFINKHGRDTWNDLTGKTCWKSMQSGQSGPCEFCTNDLLLDAEGQPTGIYGWEFQNTTNGKWYDCRDQAILWIDGRLVRLEVATDITERKQMEEALNAERNRVVYILEGTNAGTWDWNVQTGNVTVNERWAQIMGHTVKELEPININTWINKVHPDDLSVVNAMLDQHFRKEEGCLSVEFRQPHKDGSWVWVHARGKVVEWMDDGKPLRMSGTHIDITERKQNEEQIAASLKEKEVLLREIHHRVKNNMQVIVSLLRIHARRSRSERIQQIFDDCRNRVNAMSLIHEALYQSDNLAQINFEAYLMKLCRYLSQAYGTSDKSITVSVEESGVKLGMDQGIAVGMVVCELVSNAFKHAFPKGQDGVVSISLSSLDEKEINLIVQDDGIGLPIEIDIHNSPSLGLYLTVAAVTGELGGSIEVERKGGTRFIIRFKSTSA